MQSCFPHGRCEKKTVDGSTGRKSIELGSGTGIACQHPAAVRCHCPITSVSVLIMRGMNRDITRRDFLNGALLGSGALLLGSASPGQLFAQTATTTSNDDWTGYGGVGDYANSNGNTTGVLEAGHQIRDGLFESLPANAIDTG